MKTMQRKELATNRQRRFPGLYKVKTETVRRMRQFFGRVWYGLALAATITAAVVTFSPACLPFQKSPGNECT